MPYISISLHRIDGDSSACVLNAPKDGPFISLSLSPSVSVYLPGYGAECAAAARLIAASLLRAAEEVDAMLAPQLDPVVQS